MIQVRARVAVFVLLAVGLSATAASGSGRSDAGGGVAAIRAGQDAERAGQRQAALEAYSRAIESPDLSPAQRAFAYTRRGGVKGFLGENVGAIDDYSKALDLNPRLGTALSLRGYLRGVIGQYDLAERDHLAAIEAATDQTWDAYLPWALQHYADLHRRRREFDRALAVCADALRVKEYAAVYFRRAWIYLDMGRTADARAEFLRFETEMQRQNVPWDVFWPDERGAISRLRELR